MDYHRMSVRIVTGGGLHRAKDGHVALRKPRSAPCQTAILEAATVSQKPKRSQNRRLGTWLEKSPTPCPYRGQCKEGRTPPEESLSPCKRQEYRTIENSLQGGYGTAVVRLGRLPSAAWPGPKFLSSELRVQVPAAIPAEPSNLVITVSADLAFRKQRCENTPNVNNVMCS